jgi:hypothetical protein
LEVPEVTLLLPDDVLLLLATEAPLLDLLVYVAFEVALLLVLLLLPIELLLLLVVVLPEDLRV